MAVKKRQDTRRRTSKGPSVNDQLLRRHRQELQSTGHPIYSLFDVIENADLGKEDLAALREQAAKVAELAIYHRARVGAEIVETVKLIVELGMPEAHDVLSALEATVTEAARSSKRGLELILRDFGHWVGQINPEARQALCEALPRLAPCVHQMGGRGITELLRSTHKAKAPAACRAVLRSVAEYGATDARVILSMCHVAERASRLDSLDSLERLVGVLPALKVMNRRDGRRLFPAMVKLSDVCGEQGKAVWCQAFDLIYALASQNFPGAYIAARDLPKCMKQIPRDALVLNQA